MSSTEGLESVHAFVSMQILSIPCGRIVYIVLGNLCRKFQTQKDKITFSPTTMDARHISGALLTRF
jgi:hypothetical protein